VTLDDFKKQIQRLKSTWGDRHYTVERVGLLWREHKYTPKDLFKKAVDALILNSKYAPLGKDIYIAVSKAKEKAWDHFKEGQYIDTSKVTINTEAGKLLKDYFKGNIGKEFKDQAMTLADNLDKTINHQCYFCEGDGFIVARHRKENWRKSFKCVCPLANTMHLKAKWDDNMVDDWEPLKKGL